MLRNFSSHCCNVPQLQPLTSGNLEFLAGRGYVDFGHSSLNTYDLDFWSVNLGNYYPKPLNLGVCVPRPTMALAPETPCRMRPVSFEDKQTPPPLPFEMQAGILRQLIFFIRYLVGVCIYIYIDGMLGCPIHGC